MSGQPVITKSQLIKDVRSLGAAEGRTVMPHVSVKNIGWVVGGPDVVIEAILDVLTPQGTLMMLAGCEDGTYEMSVWPEEYFGTIVRDCLADGNGRMDGEAFR